MLGATASEVSDDKNQHLWSSYYLPDCDEQDACITALNPPRLLPLISLFYKPQQGSKRWNKVSQNLNLNPLQPDPSTQGLKHKAWLPPEGKRTGQSFLGRMSPPPIPFLAVPGGS